MFVRCVHICRVYIVCCVYIVCMPIVCMPLLSSECFFHQRFNCIFCVCCSMECMHVICVRRQLYIVCMCVRTCVGMSDWRSFFSLRV